jgi:hypothetical protein
VEEWNMIGHAPKIRRRMGAGLSPRAKAIFDQACTENAHFGQLGDQRYNPRNCKGL